MKLLLVPFITFLLAIQEIGSYRSFQLNNGEVIWAHEFENNQSQEENHENILRQLKINPWIETISDSNGEITATIRDMKIDYKRFGRHYLNTSVAVRTGLWSGRIRILVKDKKYKAFVYGLHYKAIIPERTAGKLSLEAHETTGTLGDWALTDYKTKFKKSRFTNLDLIHIQLKNTFTLFPEDEKSTEW